MDLVVTPGRLQRGFELRRFCSRLGIPGPRNPPEEAEGWAFDFRPPESRLRGRRSEGVGTPRDPTTPAARSSRGLAPGPNDSDPPKQTPARGPAEPVPVRQRSSAAQRQRGRRAPVHVSPGSRWVRSRNTVVVAAARSPAFRAVSSRQGESRCTTAGTTRSASSQPCRRGKAPDVRDDHHSVLVALLSRGERRRRKPCRRQR
jgi:hypothetical protein